MFDQVYSWKIIMRFIVRYIIIAETISNYLSTKILIRVHIAFCLELWCPINSQTGRFEQNFRNSYKKYFFTRTVSKLSQFTPFASINIPSKRELLIISAKVLPLSCASIHKSSLIDHTLFNYILAVKGRLNFWIIFRN